MRLHLMAGTASILAANIAQSPPDIGRGSIFMRSPVFTPPNDQGLAFMPQPALAIANDQGAADDSPQVKTQGVITGEMSGINNSVGQNDGGSRFGNGLTGSALDHGAAARGAVMS